VAALVLSAIVVASGAAESARIWGDAKKAPKKVGKKYTGKYDNAACHASENGTRKKKSRRKKGEGKFEWHPGVVKVKQMSKGGKRHFSKKRANNAVGCESETSSGEYSGRKPSQAPDREVQKNAKRRAWWCTLRRT